MPKKTTVKEDDEPKVPPKGQSINQAFDLDEVLGDTKAPRKAKDEELIPMEPPKPLTAEEKKKAAEEAKKEASRQAFLKKHPTVVKGTGVIARAAFSVGAIVAKEKDWNLTPEEEKALGDAWEPVVAIYGPEWLLKALPVIGAVVITGKVLAEKGSAIAEKKKAKEAAKKQKIIDDMNQATKDAEAARLGLEQERLALEKAQKKKGK